MAIGGRGLLGGMGGGGGLQGAWGSAPNFNGGGRQFQGPPIVAGRQQFQGPPVSGGNQQYMGPPVSGVGGRPSLPPIPQPQSGVTVSAPTAAHYGGNPNPYTPLPPAPVVNPTLGAAPGRQYQGPPIVGGRQEYLGPPTQGGRALQGPPIGGPRPTLQRGY